MNGAAVDSGILGPRAGGAFLVAAAVLFWIAWSLMPGVGVTDAALILDTVGQRRQVVKLSVALQLASAACYAPGLVSLSLRARAEEVRVLALAATVLLVGAMGSAADAVFHWLAVEMTASGVSREAMLPVMRRMQGPALAAIGPLIAAFFVGSWALAVAAVRAGWVPRACAALALLSPLVVTVGAAPVQGSARFAGLLFLACIVASQAWIGLALRSRPLGR
jgi:hypothetical protein